MLIKFHIPLCISWDIAKETLSRLHQLLWPQHLINLAPKPCFPVKFLPVIGSHLAGEIGQQPVLNYICHFGRLHSSYYVIFFTGMSSQTMFFLMLVDTSDWQTLVRVQSLAKMAQYVDLYLNIQFLNQFLINLFCSCLNKVTKVHSYANSATLLIFLQVRSSVAVGTPDYISPEILQVCMEVTFLSTNYLINQSDSRHHFEIPVGPRMKQFIIIYYKFLVGGAVSSWFVRSTPVRAVWVRALAGDIVLCSWAIFLGKTLYSHSASLHPGV